MKVNITLTILASAIALHAHQVFAKNEESKLVEISGHLPTWNVLITADNAVNEENIKKSLEKERDHKKARSKTLSRGITFWLVGSTGVGLLLNSASCAESDDFCRAGSSRSDYPDSTLEQDFAVLQEEFIGQLNKELADASKSTEDGDSAEAGDDNIGTKSFIKVHGFVQSITLDRSSGVLVRFTTTKGYGFERINDENGAIYYRGKNPKFENKNKPGTILIFNIYKAINAADESKTQTDAPADKQK